jgi:hypothetical protein
VIGARRDELRALEARLAELRDAYLPRRPILELEQAAIGREWDKIADRAAYVRGRLRLNERRLFRLREPKGRGGNAP